MYIDLEMFNYYGLYHDEVNESFEGDLTYCGTFCLKDMYNPCAVYKSRKPNIEKGHKKYLLLHKRSISCPQGTDGCNIKVRYKWSVGGFTPAEMKKERKQLGITCLECGDVIYSVMRHDYRKCECGASFIDGGKDYTGYNPDTSILVDIDLITGEATIREGK